LPAVRTLELNFGDHRELIPPTFNPADRTGQKRFAVAASGLFAVSREGSPAETLRRRGFEFHLEALVSGWVDRSGAPPTVARAFAPGSRPARIPECHPCD